MSQTSSSKVGIRDPWLLLVLFPIILVIVVSSITVTIAFKTKDDPVIDDYYKEGRLIDRRFAAEQLAASQGLHADVDFDFVSGEITVRLSSIDSETLSSYEQLNFYISHPQKADLDLQLPLTAVGYGRYRVDVERVLSGFYYLRLSATQQQGQIELWRLSGEIDFNQQKSAELIP